MRLQGLAETLIFDGKESAEELMKAIELADVIIARPNTAELVKGIKEKYPNKKIVDKLNGRF